jgi:hypothetical protein
MSIPIIPYLRLDRLFSKQFRRSQTAVTTKYLPLNLY